MSNKFFVLIPQFNPPKTYLNALSEVGLDCVCEFFPTDLSNYKGLVLPGGGDVYPFFYNKKINFTNANLIKDAVEFKIISYFLDKNLPILAICRGLQLINVYFGGTLKNVENHQGKRKNDVSHDLIPPQNGFLKNFRSANSNHRQCVDVLCKNACNVCFSKDGVVEGFYANANIFAVQFHPERMDLSAVLSIFGEFAKAVKSIV